MLVFTSRNVIYAREKNVSVDDYNMEAYHMERKRWGG